MASSRCSTPTRSWRPCVIGRPEMKRRRALGAIGWSVVSALSSRDTAWSQTSSPRAGSRDAFLPDRTASAPGITTRDIRIGMTAAFKGANAGPGTELYRGAQACYAEINARGGIHGRMVSVIALDDGYEPTPCIRNTIDLIEKEQVFFLSNYVGTPTLTRALPVIKRYADHQVVLVGNFTGAQPQREEPFADQVFNIRPPYRQEMMALAERFCQLGAWKFAFYYQIAPNVRSCTAAAARDLAQRGTKIAAEATYVRGAKVEDDMTPAVQALRQA